MGKLGVEVDTARAIAEAIFREGALVRKIGVDEASAAMLASLHTHTWFAYPGAEGTLHTQLGSRQGCRFGGVVFNIIYSRVLHTMREKLVEAEAVDMMCFDPDAPPWIEPTGAKTQRVPVHEVVYVDDEAIFVSGGTPAGLEKKVCRAAQLVV